MKFHTPSTHENEVFRDRALRFQSSCGWCARVVGVNDEVFSVGGKARSGIDLALVEGKVIEIGLSDGERVILAAVCGFDSDAKREGNDLIFLVCSKNCGQDLKLTLAREMAGVGSPVE